LLQHEPTREKIGDNPNSYFTPRSVFSLSSCVQQLYVPLEEWSITFLLCHIISPPLSSFYYSNYFFLRSTDTNKTLTRQHRIQCNHICQYVSGVGHSHMSDTRTHIQSEILSDCSFVYYFVLIISTIMIFFSASSLYINTHKWFYKVIL
jgi:hypothetical protein